MLEMRYWLLGLLGMPDMATAVDEEVDNLETLTGSLVCLANKLG
jgi:hypothetical protein